MNLLRWTAAAIISCMGFVVFVLGFMILWNMWGQCFNPPFFMQDQWIWRLSAIPLGFVLFVLVGAAGAAITILPLMWAAETK